MTRPFERRAIVALISALAPAPVLGAAGCIDAFEPEVGPPLAARCDDADSDPAVDVSYTREVAPELDEYCGGCHTPEGRSPTGIQVGGLNISTYASLRAGGAVRGTDNVIPGQPCASGLIQKILPYPPFGARMPLNGPPFLEAHDIQLFHDWIAEGAREN